MHDSIPVTKAKPPVAFVAALIVWIIFFVLSIIMAGNTEPTGDGFTRGMNRTMVFLQWQAAAFVVSLIAFFMARSKSTNVSQTLRFLGKTPLYTHCVILVFVVCVVLYIMFTN